MFSKDSRRLGAIVKIRAVDMDKPAKDRPKTGMAFPGFDDRQDGSL